MTESNEYTLRLQKIQDLKSLGINPYPHNFSASTNALALHREFEGQPVGNHEDAHAKRTPLVSVAGRLVLFRAMGKNVFAHLQDHTDRIQIMLSKDFTELSGYTPQGEEALTHLKFIEKKVDLGDILGAEGYIFRTQKGELTVLVTKLTLLCKTLHPLPDKHAGLEDKETRYRKRWLDLIANPDVRQTFFARSKILKGIRDYLHNQGFMEVETPVLQSIYGGAEARPFTTTLHALDQEMFLRISLEPPLKKLIVGGFNKVFEMGRVFRNEGIDRSHNPEFTLLEAYAAYYDYNDMMKLVENLFADLAEKVYGSTQIPAVIPGTETPVLLELKGPWKRISMIDSLKEYAKIDVDTLSDDQIKKMLLDPGHADPKELIHMTRGLLIGALFEVYVEPHLIQPHHIIDHPIETTPFAKLHRDPKMKEQGFVERFESFILRSEVCNSYTELNDPVLQKELLEGQASRREIGDEEAAPYDAEFVEAIEQGMPPTGGLGIGVDRLVMLLTQALSIRDVLLFPWVKPKA